MRSDATTVEQYLVESINWGMIAYSVPLTDVESFIETYENTRR